MFNLKNLLFKNTLLVWKVAGKMFCLGDIQAFEHIALKCDPERALELRETYPQITGAFHMNKTHWNDVHLDGLPQSLIAELIQHSYDIVVQKLPKTTRELIKNT
jgi:predicted DNA-binding protein (MmcQ/YjbR family)